VEGSWPIEELDRSRIEGGKEDKNWDGVIDGRGAAIWGAVTVGGRGWARLGPGNWAQFLAISRNSIHMNGWPNEKGEIGPRNGGENGVCGT
jgi:hypothetical protein